MSLEERLTELERRLKELEKHDMPTLWPLYMPGAVPIQTPQGPVSTGTPLPWRGSTIC